jgi:hypothetical protein
VNLPTPERAVVEQTKIVEYLLAFDHPEGAGKAECFARFGFPIENWQLLAGALIAHAKTNPVSSELSSEFETKYRIDGPIACPDGRSPSIRAVWIVDKGTDAPRLVTAYPL